jgi:hypothetical protein
MRGERQPRHKLMTDGQTFAKANNKVFLNAAFGKLNVNKSRLDFFVCLTVYYVAQGGQTNL